MIRRRLLCCLQMLRILMLFHCGEWAALKGSYLLDKPRHYPSQCHIYKHTVVTNLYFDSETQFRELFVARIGKKSTCIVWFLHNLKKDKPNSFIFTWCDKPQRHRITPACLAGAETVLACLTFLIKEYKLLDKQKEMLNHILTLISEHQTKDCT